jgi:uncharacterized protein YjeT (DUF2065 family)
MADLMTALALAITIEGMLYALFPAAMQRMMAEALKQPAGVLRTAGVAAAGGGVLLLWLVRG